MAKQVEEVGGIRVRIRGLHDGSHPLEVKSTAEVLELPMFRRDLHIKGNLVKDHERVNIDAKVTAIADLECSRCTEPASFEVEAPMHIELVPPHLALPGIEEEDEIHIYDAFESPTFDMVQDVRDALGVAIPMKVLCKPNCKGLCPICGTNWNNGTCDCEQPIAESAWTSSLKDLQEKLRKGESGASER
jgi:uncharacterized protein